MRYLVLIFTFFITNLSFAGDNNHDIKEFMQAYLDGYEKYLTAGENADVAWVTEHFTEPLVMMPTRGPAPMATHADFAPNIKYFLEKSLKAKGIVKLKWERMQIARLSETQAMISGLANTLDKDGKRVDQRASIYLLTKTKAGWHVSVNLPHPPKNNPKVISKYSAGT